MKIKVEIKSQYGTKRIFPVCKTAEAFVKLTGRKCLSRADLAIIEGLGYTVEVVTPKL